MQQTKLFMFLISQIQKVYKRKRNKERERKKHISKKLSFVSLFYFSITECKTMPQNLPFSHLPKIPQIYIDKLKNAEDTKTKNAAKECRVWLWY